MHINFVTKCIIVLLPVLGALCMMSGNPTAHIEEMNHFGKIVQFEWIGWPIPLVYGSIPYSGGTATEAMNRFLFDDGHAYFAIGVWAFYLFALTVVVACAVEVAWRGITHVRLRRAA